MKPLYLEGSWELGHRMGILMMVLGAFVRGNIMFHISSPSQEDSEKLTWRAVVGCCSLRS